MILSGAGATFPAPLYARWFEIYQKKADVRIGYQRVGSGEGIRQIIARNVDFGASDAFLTDDELQKNALELLHIPTCLGAVAVIYNLQGGPMLRLTPEVLADIYHGRIVSWADSRLAALNRNHRFPRAPIKVVSRLDGSGTTFIFTDYLAKVSPSWRESVGRGKKVVWPVGLRVAGNGGVADMVGRIPGSIGYVSVNYAAKRDLPVAALRNRAGYFIRPTSASVSAAGNVQVSSDARMMITDTPAARGYPISAFTYLLVYREQAYDMRSRAKAETIVDLLRWIIHEGQIYNHELDFAPLPKRIIENTDALLTSMTYDGRPIQ